MKQVLIVLICGVFGATSVQSQAKGLDAEDGKNAFETCRGCHSTPNYNNAYPTFYVPKIGGQRKGYIASALTAYKHEKRPRSSMLANTYDLTAEMTDAIALYIEAAAGTKSKSNYTDGNAKKGKALASACLACHTNDLEDGATAPILAGQHGNFLVKVMKDYQLGKRKDPVMQGMVAKFSEQDLKDIATYFARKKGLAIVK